MMMMANIMIMITFITIEFSYYDGGNYYYYYLPQLPLLLLPLLRHYNKKNTCDAILSLA